MPADQESGRLGIGIGLPGTGLLSFTVGDPGAAGLVMGGATGLIVGALGATGGGAGTALAGGAVGVNGATAGEEGAAGLAGGGAGVSEGASAGAAGAATITFAVLCNSLISASRLWCLALRT